MTKRFAAILALIVMLLLSLMSTGVPASAQTSPSSSHADCGWTSVEANNPTGNWLHINSQGHLFGYTGDNVVAHPVTGELTVNSVVTHSLAFSPTGEVYNEIAAGGNTRWTTGYSNNPYPSTMLWDGSAQYPFTPTHEHTTLYAQSGEFAVGSAYDPGLMSGYAVDLRGATPQELPSFPGGNFFGVLQTSDNSFMAAGQYITGTLSGEASQPHFTKTGLPLGVETPQSYPFVAVYSDTGWITSTVFTNPGARFTDISQSDNGDIVVAGDDTHNVIVKRFHQGEWQNISVVPFSSQINIWAVEGVGENIWVGGLNSSTHSALLMRFDATWHDESPNIPGSEISSIRNTPLGLYASGYINGQGALLLKYACATPTVVPTATGTKPPEPPADTPTPTGTPRATPTDCANPFADMDEHNPFYGAVHYLYCRGVVNGTDSTHYSPARTATRAQFAKVVVLGFNLGGELYTPVQPTFTDVPPSYYAYAYIETGYNKGLLNGYDAPTCTAQGATYPCYLPNRAITRAQVTKLVVNAARYVPFTPTGGQPTFPDVTNRNVFFTVIETAHHHGVINGYTDGLFHPDDNIRRDAMAQIVYMGIKNP